MADEIANQPEDQDEDPQMPMGAPQKPDNHDGAETTVADPGRPDDERDPGKRGPDSARTEPEIDEDDDDLDDEDEDAASQ